MEGSGASPTPCHLVSHESYARRPRVPRAPYSPRRTQPSRNAPAAATPHLGRVKARSWRGERTHFFHRRHLAVTPSPTMYHTTKSSTMDHPWLTRKELTPSTIASCGDASPDSPPLVILG